MHTIGSVTSHIELAQIMLYVIWVFFAGLIFYLVLKNHREGSPITSSFMKCCSYLSPHWSLTPWFAEMPWLPAGALHQKPSSQLLTTLNSEVS